MESTTTDPFDALSERWAELTEALDAAWLWNPNRARGAASWMADRMTAWRTGRPAETAPTWRTARPAPGSARDGAARCRDALEAARRAGRRKPPDDGQGAELCGSR